MESKQHLNMDLKTQRRIEALDQAFEYCKEYPNTPEFKERGYAYMFGFLNSAVATLLEKDLKPIPKKSHER